MTCEEETQVDGEFSIGEELSAPQHHFKCTHPKKE